MWLDYRRICGKVEEIQGINQKISKKMLIKNTLPTGYLLVDEYTELLFHIKIGELKLF